jgi:hypothetical protein
MVRFLAAALLAVLIPVQGYAAACAQICAVTASVAAAGEAVEHDHCAGQAPERAPGHGDGEASTLGAGKCCQAHVFTVDLRSPSGSLERAAPPQTAFVARWTSFIADKPSPPPIAAVTIA